MRTINRSQWRDIYNAMVFGAFCFGGLITSIALGLVSLLLIFGYDWPDTRIELAVVAVGGNIITILAILASF